MEAQSLALLKQAEKCIQGRDRDGARQFLQEAHGHLEHVQPDSRETLQNRITVLLKFADILQLYRKFPQNEISVVHFKIYDRHRYTPTAYQLIHDYTLLLRKKVFSDELRIPALVEKDDRDDTSFHGLVFVGDALATYGRLRIEQGSYQKSWVVIDRFCTLGSVSAMYTQRRKGYANILLNYIFAFVKNILASRQNINIVVLQIPVRSFSLVDKFRRKGFKLVISEDDYEASKSVKLPVVYFENGRPRINVTNLYFPLPGADTQQLNSDLQDIFEFTQKQIKCANDPMLASQANAMVQNNCLGVK